MAPKLYILDNEISNEFKNALLKYNLAYQRVPPHIHRRNAAERAIRTFKNHFLAGLATCDPKFPVKEWDRLLEQATLTLNLLRTSRVNPRLSSWAYLFGHFDFNTTPLALPGTKVIIHEKPQQRASWAFHGVDGWYIGPSPEHYRCVKCFLPTQKSERDADTVSFHPHTVEFPAVSTLDYLKQASDDILHILCNPQQAFPYLEGGDQTKNAYVKIAQLLNRAAVRPTPPTVTQQTAPDLTPHQERRTVEPPPGFVPIQQIPTTRHVLPTRIITPQPIRPQPIQPRIQQQTRVAEPRVIREIRPPALPRVIEEDEDQSTAALPRVVEEEPI